MRSSSWPGFCASLACASTSPAVIAAADIRTRAFTQFVRAYDNGGLIGQSCAGTLVTVQGGKVTVTLATNSAIVIAVTDRL